MRRDSFEIDTSRLREPQRASTERTSFVLNAHDAAGKGSSFVYISSGKGCLHSLNLAVFLFFICRVDVLIVSLLLIVLLMYTYVMSV